MKNRELLERITHNKVLLFIVPNFIYMSVLFYIYNNNFDVDHINRLLAKLSLYTKIIKTAYKYST